MGTPSVNKKNKMRMLNLLMEVINQSKHKTERQNLFDYLNLTYSCIIIFKDTPIEETDLINKVVEVLILLLHGGNTKV